jgi:hypothetical protein
MKLTLFVLSLAFSTYINSQEVNFFRDITCEPTQKKIGNALKISFRKSNAYLKIFEYEKKKKTVEKSDLFPTKTLESHIFLSRKFCQFHIISRRPSVDYFHFVMNVDNLKSNDINYFEGPAHFNFLIDEIYLTEKDHKLVNCKIHGLRTPGYYYHSCKKKKLIIKPKKNDSPTRTEPKYQYYQNKYNDGNQNGSSSSQ